MGAGAPRGPTVPWAGSLASCRILSFFIIQAWSDGMIHVLPYCALVHIIWLELLLGCSEQVRPQLPPRSNPKERRLARGSG